VTPRVLVTGATGFLGSHLVRRLAADGAEVHAVSRGPVPPEASTMWWQADLESPRHTEDLIRTVRPDVVYHLASHVTGARDVALVMPMLRSNLESTVNVMTAAVSSDLKPRVVIAGSMEEPRAEDPLVAPSSPYAAAKAASTSYAQMFHHLWDLPTVVLRIAMAYGPGQPDKSKLLPYVIISLLGEKVPALSDGTREIDWVYVDDVVDALLAAGTVDGVAGEVIDLGSGTAVSIRETVRLLADIVGSEQAPEFGVLPRRNLDSSRIADTSRAKELLGWIASTGLHDGMARTVGWYREQW